MRINLHKNARTTPAQRKFIQENAQIKISTLAARFGVSETTIRKWRKRSSVYDKPHTPRKIYTALTPVQELAAMLVRLCFRSSLDDLLQVTNRFIHSSCSRSSLNRCLKRYHLSKLTSINRYLSVDTMDFRGTYLFYTRIYFPRFSLKGRHMAADTILDCSFRWCDAQLTDQPMTPPLKFINRTIEKLPINVLGLISAEPIVLSCPYPELELSIHRYRELIRQFCKINQMDSFFISPAEEQTILLLRDLCQRLEKENRHFPGTLIGRWNDQTLSDNIATYHTLPQRYLRGKSPDQAMDNHYRNFPSSFNNKPEHQKKLFAFQERR